MRPDVMEWNWTRCGGMEHGPEWNVDQIWQNGMGTKCECETEGILPCVAMYAFGFMYPYMEREITGLIFHSTDCR